MGSFQVSNKVRLRRDVFQSREAFEQAPWLRPATAGETVVATAGTVAKVVDLQLLDGYPHRGVHHPIIELGDGKRFTIAHYDVESA